MTKKAITVPAFIKNLDPKDQSIAKDLVKIFYEATGLRDLKKLHPVTLQV